VKEKHKFFILLALCGTGGRPASSKPTKINKSLEKVAGHIQILEKGPHIHKLVKDKNDREEIFYRNLPASFQSITAKFFGSIEDKNSKKRFIALENLLWGIKKPAMMDVKVGFKFYRDDAPEIKKKKRELSHKNSTLKSLGIHIMGMKFYKKQILITRDNRWSKEHLTKENFAYAGLKPFFQENFTLIDESIREVTKIYHLVSKEKRIELISSSILFVYDSDNPSTISVKVIDFGQSDVNKQTANNQPYLKGLKNLQLELIRIKGSSN